MMVSKYQFVFLVGCLFVWVFITRGVPYVSIVGLDVFLCLYIMSMFREKMSVFFMLHPIILIIISSYYLSSFLDIGDGPSYYAVVHQYFDSNTMRFQGYHIYEAYGLLGFFKYANLGAVPVIILPEYIYGNISDKVYYLWQGLINLFFVVLVVRIVLDWRVYKKKEVLIMALFSAVSPSFFDLGGALTRHIITFFGIFLLFFTHHALVKRITFERLFWYVISFVVVLVSKAPLLLPYLIYVILDILYLRKGGFDKIKMTQLVVILFMIIYLGEYLFETTNLYLDGTANTGAATFSGLTRIPIIGWIVKYVYALLSPFPWSKYVLYLKDLYAGNVLLFVMHVMSALTGMYLFVIILFRWKSINNSDYWFKSIVYYPLVMSTSILAGSTGFHTYLLIYFPILSPLILYKEYRMNLLIPIAIIALLEAFMVMGK